MASRRLKRTAKATGGLLAAAAVFAPAAHADPFEVNSLADDGDGACDATCTLRDAVSEANFHDGADEVTFAPNVVGEIQLSDNNFAIRITSDSLDIRGPGADKLAIVGGQNDRIFKIFGFDTPNEQVSISGLTLTDGHAQNYFMECDADSGDGGAILSTNNFDCDEGFAAALTVSKVAVVDNNATGGGGGIVVEQEFDDVVTKEAAATGAASLSVRQSTINANDAGYDGGGVAMYPGAGDLAVSNSTIVDNNANGGDGGGIEVLSEFPVASKAPGDRVLALENATLTGNDASEDGGGIATDSDFRVSSSIVSDNTVTPLAPKAGTGPDLFTDGATFTVGHSLLGTTSGAALVEDPADTNLVGLGAQLGALADNGGPTQTRLPATTSPAIDAGIANALTVEQRGTARTTDRPPANAADGTDMGAVEIEAEPVQPGPEPEPEPEPDPTPLPAPAPELCLGREVILTKGGDIDEKLTGFGVDDGIFAGGGQDEVFGIGGDDCLYGQVGNDKVEGGPGDDNANGDRDDDIVRGDGGSDSVRGQNGNDRVYGGPGDDARVTGGAGDDYVSGGEGTDFVKGDGGNDVILLGGDSDFVHAGGGADVINAADHDADNIICGTGKDVANVDPEDKVDKDCNTVNVVSGSRRPSA